MMFHVTVTQGHSESNYTLEASTPAAATARAVREFTPGSSLFTVAVLEVEGGLLHVGAPLDAEAAAPGDASETDEVDE